MSIASGKQKVKAELIKVDMKHIPVQKALQDAIDSTPSSNYVDDYSGHFDRTKDLLGTPYDKFELASFYDYSTDLGKLVNSMVTNTLGFGYRIKRREMSPEFYENHKEEIDAEKVRLSTYLECLHPEYSLTELRERKLKDKHLMGDGYLELIHNKLGKIVGLDHIPGHLVRLSLQDRKPIPVRVPNIDPVTFNVVYKTHYYRFRRYAVINDNQIVWYKQSGDPRHLNIETGEFESEYNTLTEQWETSLPFEYQANALIRSTHYHPLSAYGIPVYIGNLISLMGSRSAEEINYSTLSSNAIPSMLVIAENGHINEETIKRFKEFSENHIQRTSNFSQFLLVEGDANTEGIASAGNLKLRIEPLKQLQQQDELFQNYDKNNRDKLRESFRLPKLFIGDTLNINRAAANTIKQVTNEQVFAPERTKEDDLINRHIVVPNGFKYHVIKSRHPNITDDTELANAAEKLERSGGMTPEIAYEIVKEIFGDDIAPPPEGINLRVPWSLQFAQAQNNVHESTNPMVEEPDVEATDDSENED